MKSVGQAVLSIREHCYSTIATLLGTWVDQMGVATASAIVMLLSFGRSDAGPQPAVAAGPTLVSYARPGLLVTIPSGGRINIRCTGAGSPTVILTAGAGDQSLTWQGIQSALPRSVRVCAWDRPGFGFSDPGTEALDVVHLTDSLEAALVVAMIEPPYVLVGHSLGSFETLMFAFRHPKDVSGIVLVDPAGPFQDERLAKAAPATYALIDGFQTSQTAHLRHCILEMEKRPVTDDDCLMKPVEDYPVELNLALIRIDSDVAVKKEFLSLLDSMFSGLDSRELKQAWHSLGAIPLIVLTAGKPPPIPVKGAAEAQMSAFQAEWSKMHDDMAALSNHGVNRLVPDATHYIHHERPQVVVDVINEVIIATAKGRE